MTKKVLEQSKQTSPYRSTSSQLRSPPSPLILPSIESLLFFISTVPVVSPQSPPPLGVVISGPSPDRYILSRLGGYLSPRLWARQTVRDCCDCCARILDSKLSHIFGSHCLFINALPPPCHFLSSFPRRCRNPETLIPAHPVPGIPYRSPARHHSICWRIERYTTFELCGYFLSD